MAKVGATEFKARCLELMDRVAKRRETYVITKHGKPVAKLVPADVPARKSSFGCMAGEMQIVGDLSEARLASDQEWHDRAPARGAVALLGPRVAAHGEGLRARAGRAAARGQRRRQDALVSH